MIASASASCQLLGVLHAGGTLNDATLQNQTPAHVRNVFAPKASGANSIIQVHSLPTYKKSYLIRHCMFGSTSAQIFIRRPCKMYRVPSALRSARFYPSLDQLPV